MSQPGRSIDQHESRAAVALTVAWMLSCTSTAAAVLLVIALRLIMLAFPVVPGGVHPLAGMSGVFLFVAMMTGVACLLLTWLAFRVRQVPPPRQVAIAAILIGIAPLMIGAVLTTAALWRPR